MGKTNWIEFEEAISQLAVSSSQLNAGVDDLREKLATFRLKEIRKATKKTQIQLAKKLGVSQNRVSLIEGNEIEKAQISTIKKYVEALGGNLHVTARFGDQEIELLN